MPQYCRDQIETLWLLYRQAYMPKSISHMLTGGVYHLPNADNKLMISNVMDCLDQMSKQHPNLGVIILGDFNSLPDTELRSYPLRQIVARQTRGHSILDKFLQIFQNGFYLHPYFQLLQNLITMLFC